ncbi:MAG: murein hydrolase activator EnvC family protein [Anaerovoracaceae bacterium]|jgi:murein DD-endopeptidase MepM/ murein hydrolase activator NlpD
MNKKLRIILVLTLVFVVGLTSAFGATKAQIDQSIKEKKKELALGQKEELELGRDIDNLQNRIGTTQKEINVLAGEIASTQNEIDATQKKLDKKKKELEKSIDGLNDRLRNMYKSGTIGFIDVILSSEDVSELLSNLEMVKKIYAGDKDLVEALQEEYEAIEKEQEELNVMKADLDQKKSSLSEKEAALQADKSAVESKKAQVKESNATLQADMEELQAQSAAIERELQAAYAAQNAQQSGSSGGSSSGSTGNTGNTGGPTYSGGSMLWPVPSSHYITSPFGYRIHPIFGVPKFHSGIDISCSGGAAIVAANSGVVYNAGWMGGYGNTVIVDHGGGISTLYAHNSAIYVSPGQRVSRGQTIAGAGTTGNSTGVHLHFEVRVNGTPVNPQGGYV